MFLYIDCHMCIASIKKIKKKEIGIRNLIIFAK